MKKKTSLWRRLIRWTLRGLALVLVLLIAAAATGALWQAYSAHRDAKRYPPPGELVDIGGRNLHLQCMGNGSPTVVIDAGAQDWSTGWQRPQQAIAELTRVCSYDRAGLGWSDSSSDPKDGLHMVADLHALLDAAQVERPIVLVGHSLGGMLNRIYYDESPEEVAGMVLAEPGDPALVQEMFPESQGVVAYGSWLDTLSSITARIGLLRWVYKDLFEGKNYPQNEIEETRARMVLPSSVAALASTIRHLPVTAAQTKDNTTLGDIPLVVIYSTNFDEVGTHFESEEERQQFRRDSIAGWEHLTSLSSQGRTPLIVEGANHVTLIRDDLYWPQVVEAVGQVISEIR